MVTAAAVLKSVETNILARVADKHISSQTVFCNCFSRFICVFVEELDFLNSYDITKQAIQNIIDMPDRLIDLFIQCCLHNNGRLSARKRESYFDFLTNDELTLLEQAVQTSFTSAPAPAPKA